MVENVVLPTDVDPGLTNAFETKVLKNLAAVREFLPWPVSPGDDHNFVVGFASSRETAANDANPRTLKNAVIRFASPQDAVAAANQLTAASGSVRGDDDQTMFTTARIDVSSHPETSAVTFPYLGTAVVAYTAHGPFVLCQYATARTGLPTTALELVSKTLDQQVPLLDRFTLTPVDQLQTLPLDPTGLLARMLPIAPENALVNDNAVYSTRAWRHFINNHGATFDAVFDAGKVQSVAKRLTKIYVSADGGGARDVAARLAGWYLQNGQKATEGVKGLGAAKCFAGDTMVDAAHCVLTVDQYTIEASTGQVTDAQQQVAAQYLMLTTR